PHAHALLIGFCQKTGSRCVGRWSQVSAARAASIHLGPCGRRQGTPIPPIPPAPLPPAKGKGEDASVASAGSPRPLRGEGLGEGVPGGMMGTLVGRRARRL